jgi:hypothetical protein
MNKQDLLTLTAAIIFATRHSRNSTKHVNDKELDESIDDAVNIYNSVEFELEAEFSKQESLRLKTEGTAK